MHLTQLWGWYVYGTQFDKLFHYDLIMNISQVITIILKHKFLNFINISLLYPLSEYFLMKIYFINN